MLLGHDWLQHCDVHVNAQDVSNPLLDIRRCLGVQRVSGPISGLVRKYTSYNLDVSFRVSSHNCGQTHWVPLVPVTQMLAASQHPPLNAPF